MARKPAHTPYYVKVTHWNNSNDADTATDFRKGNLGYKIFRSMILNPTSFLKNGYFLDSTQ